MTYHESRNTVELHTSDMCFSPSETLESGQCFRFSKKSPDEYEVTAMGKTLTLGGENGKIIFQNTTLEEFENIWLNYFDLKRDYKQIQDVLTANDIIMRDAVDFAPGIRILKQEPWECLISFIISQNNRIPMIKQVVKNLCERFGEMSTDGSFSFPSPSVLARLHESDITECKSGFRAKYILDAARKVESGEVEINGTEKTETGTLRENLMRIKGVGEKVADCVMLFSMKRHEVFPTDVWVKRIMQKLYLNGKDTSLKEIRAYAERRFGAYAGFAQQYLFHYARLNKIV